MRCAPTINREIRYSQAGRSRPFAVAGVLLVTIAVPLTFYYFWRVGYTSDIAMSGLMAKAILEHGDRPIFQWRIGYQGVLVEAYAMAFLYRIFGAGPRTLSLFNMLVFWLMLGLFHKHLKDVFDKGVALLATLILTLSAPRFYAYVMRPQPNYTEIFVIGLLLIMIVRRLIKRLYVDRQPPDARSHRFFLAAGFLAGFGKYTYGQIDYFFLIIFMEAAILYLHDRHRRPSPAGRGVSFIKFISLALAVVPLGIGLGAFALGQEEILLPGAATPVAPFKLIIGSLELMAAWAAVDVWHRHPKLWQKLWLGGGLFGLGSLLGYAPALYFQYVQLGRLTDKTVMTGTISDAIHRWQLFVYGLDEIWNLPRNVLSLPYTLVLGALFLFVLLITLRKTWRWIVERGDARTILTFSPLLILPLAVLPSFLVAGAVLDVWSTRYTLVLWFYYALALALLAKWCWASGGGLRVAAVIGLMAILGNNAWHMGQAIAESETRGFEGEHLIEVLRDRGVHVGYAYYWFAYSIDYFTNDEFQLEPLTDPRSPYYLPVVLAQPRIAVLDQNPSRYPMPTGASVRLSGVWYNVEYTWQGRDSILHILRRRPDPILSD